MKAAHADFSMLKVQVISFPVHCLMFQRESVLKISTSNWSVGKSFQPKWSTYFIFKFIILVKSWQKITASTWQQTPFLPFGSFLILIFHCGFISFSPVGILGFNQILNVTSMQFVFNRFGLQLNTSQLSEFSDLEKCSSRAFDTEGLVKAPGLNSYEMVLLSGRNGSLLSISRKIPPQFE